MLTSHKKVNSEMKKDPGSSVPHPTTIKNPESALQLNTVTTAPTPPVKLKKADFDFNVMDYKEFLNGGGEHSLSSRFSSEMEKTAINYEELKGLSKLSRPLKTPLNRLNSFKSLSESIPEMKTDFKDALAFNKNPKIMKDNFNIQNKLFNNGRASFEAQSYLTGESVESITQKEKYKLESFQNFHKKAPESINKTRYPGKPLVDFNRMVANEMPLNNKDKEVLNRVVDHHEYLETRQKNPGETFSSHVSPNVILQERNLTNTLPEEHGNIKALFNNIRKPEFQVLGNVTKVDFDRIGDQRLSRHAIKRITSNYKKNAPSSPHTIYFDPDKFNSNIEKTSTALPLVNPTWGVAAGVGTGLVTKKISEDEGNSQGSSLALALPVGAIAGVGTHRYLQGKKEFEGIQEAKQVREGLSDGIKAKRDDYVSLGRKSDVAKNFLANEGSRTTAGGIGNFVAGIKAKALGLVSTLDPQKTPESLAGTYYKDEVKEYGAGIDKTRKKVVNDAAEMMVHKKNLDYFQSKEINPDKLYGHVKVRAGEEYAKDLFSKNVSGKVVSDPLVQSGLKNIIRGEKSIFSPTRLKTYIPGIKVKV